MRGVGSSYWRASRALRGPGALRRGVDGGSKRSAPVESTACASKPGGLRTRGASRSRRREGTGLAAAVGLREFGGAVAINSSVFLLGYKVLSSGLSRAAVAHAWFLGTACLAAFQVQGYLLVCLYFVFGTLVTKIGKDIKVMEGTYERNEGKRTPASVWGSGLAAIVCATLALAFGSNQSLANLLRIGFVASFTSKLSDTVASEIGKAYGRRTILITNLKPVPRGTDGAISLEGTLAGLLASAAYAGVGLGLGQVNLAGFGACVVAAFIANNLESLLGATLQKEHGRHLSNDVVNMTQISAAAVLAMLLYSICT